LNGFTWRKQKFAWKETLQPEEFFLAIACNKMAQDGWEPINLDSRRVLFRRPAGR